jgi:putative addiction module antidote
MELKITQIGNSLGVILPKSLLADMNLGKGDRLTMDRRGDGWYMTPADAGYDAQMEVANIIMKKRRELLKRLAKA